MSGRTFLIVGGYGFAGHELAHYILQETDEHVILAGRSQEKADNAAARLNVRFEGNRVSARRADASEPSSLRTALNGVDMLLVASTTPAYTKEVLATCLEAGVDYLDIQYDQTRGSVFRSFATEIEHAGLCFVTEAGFHPGLPAVLVRYLGAQFDRLDRAVVGSILNQEGGLPYSSGVDDLVLEFRDYKADVFVDGAWRNANMTTMKDNRSIDFGPPFGRRSCTPMTLKELYDLPQMFPALRQAGFYIAGFNTLTDWVITPIIMVVLRIAPRRSVKPLGRLLCWGTRTFGSPPYGVVVKADASGEIAGKIESRSVLISHPDGYKLTAIPVVAYLLQYLDGTARRPGLHMMGHLADPGRLLLDMARMGASVATPDDQETDHATSELRTGYAAAER
jgi:hypothetical protein